MPNRLGKRSRETADSGDESSKEGQNLTSEQKLEQHRAKARREVAGQQLAHASNQQERISPGGESPDTSSRKEDNQPLDASSIRKLPTKELNQKLIAYDTYIQQLLENSRPNTSEIMKAGADRDYRKGLELKEERDKIKHLIHQQKEEKQLYWEILEERHKNGELLREDRPYYDQQRRKDLYQQHEDEEAGLNSHHQSERDSVLQESYEKGSFKHDFHAIRQYPHVAKQAEEFLNSNFPEMLQRHEEDKQKQKQKHIDNEGAFEQEIRSLHGL